MKVNKRYFGKTMKLLSGLLLIIIGMGCSSKESALLGKWYNSGDEKTATCFEFKQDGKFVSSGGGKLTVQGTWTILSDGIVKIDMTMVGINIVSLGEMKDGVLTFDIAGQSLKLKKTAAR